MAPFLALIVPVGDSPGHPAHPIAPGGGGSPPGIWPSPGHPAHPIAPGGPPPGIWPQPPGGGGQPPGIWPGLPGQGLPGQPPGFWGGGNVPMPTPPIVLPPEILPPEIELPEGKGLLVLFVPGQGHVAFVVDVPPKRPDQGLPGPQPK